MKASDREKAQFEVTDKFKKRALELLDESQAAQFAEGMRLNNAAAVVFGREQKRLLKKYGKDDVRTQEMTVRLEASALAKADLFSKYKDAITPQAGVTKGWAVDGWVRGPDGAGVEGLTVAAYDRQNNRLREFEQSLTNDQGYFSIVIDKLPAKPPAQIFLHASRGRTLLPSNEVRLEPRPGASERVEIIIRDKYDVPDPKQSETPPVVPTPRQRAEASTDKPADKPARPRASAQKSKAKAKKAKRSGGSGADKQK